MTPYDLTDVDWRFLPPAQQAKKAKTIISYAMRTLADPATRPEIAEKARLEMGRAQATLPLLPNLDVPEW